MLGADKKKSLGQNYETKNKIKHIVVYQLVQVKNSKT